MDKEAWMVRGRLVKIVEKLDVALASGWQPLSDIWQEEEDEDTTGSVVWDASLALCCFLEDHSGFFDLRHVVELGCGSGAMAVALSFLGASQVTATDRSKKFLSLTLETCQLNEVENVVVEHFELGE